MPFSAATVTSLLLTTSHQQFDAANGVDGVYSLEIDADTLAAGELAEVIIEQKFSALDGSAKPVGDPIYIAGPAPPPRAIHVGDFRDALRVTAKQIGGTMRTIRLAYKPIT